MLFLNILTLVVISFHGDTTSSFSKELDKINKDGIVLLLSFGVGMK